MLGFDAEGAYDAVWGVASVLGLLVNLYVLRDASRDVTMLERARRNGVRLLIARGRVRRDRLQVVLQMVLIVAAVGAVHTPLAMAAISCLTAVEALLAVRLRARLIAMLDAPAPPSGTA